MNTLTVRQWLIDHTSRRRQSRREFRSLNWCARINMICFIAILRTGGEQPPDVPCRHGGSGPLPGPVPSHAERMPDCGRHQVGLDGAFEERQSGVRAERHQQPAERADPGTAPAIESEVRSDADGAAWRQARPQSDVADDEQPGRESGHECGDGASERAVCEL